MTEPETYKPIELKIVQKKKRSLRTKRILNQTTENPRRMAQKTPPNKKMETQQRQQNTIPTLKNCGGFDKK